MHCWKCKKPIGIESAKISFRAECPHCGIDLHTCMGCKHHAAGKPNECAIPGTDPVRDREKANFCEEFAIQSLKEDNYSEKLKKAKRLLE